MRRFHLKISGAGFIEGDHPSPPLSLGQHSPKKKTDTACRCIGLCCCLPKVKEPPLLNKSEAYSSLKLLQAEVFFVAVMVKSLAD